MKVHLIKRQSIEKFVSKNSRSKVPFQIWLAIIKRVNWDNPGDILSTFNSADILGKGSNRVVFNIGGNKFRIVCQYYFGKNKAHLFVKWIGTHNAYNVLCKRNDQYSVNAC